jgi:PQQ-like domain
MIARAALAIAGLALATPLFLHAQGRGGNEWTASGHDAQRTAWLRTDARLTKDAIAKGDFQFLWKVKLENTTRQLSSLTSPILLDLLIGYRGFKSLGFVGGSDDRIFAVDTDLARPYWTSVLNYTSPNGGRPPSSWDCPGGLIATSSRRTVLAPSALAGRGGGGRGAPAGSAVGEPGKGAAVLSQPPPQRAGGPAPNAPAGGRAGAPGGAPGAPGAGSRGPAPIGFGGVDPIYAVASDGYIHTLLSSNGADSEPAIPFIPANAKPSSVLWVDGVVYTTTSGDCGAAPNAVWAMDLTPPAKERKTLSWKTGGASIAGTTGVALGTDGTVFVALGQPAAQAQAGSHADAVMALDGATLQPKDWFVAEGADFNTSPIVIKFKDKDLVAAAGNDGRLYVLDATSLGGADHKTPLAVSGKYTSSGAGAALATWEDQGTRWILAPATGAPPGGVSFSANGLAPNGRVVAFKLTDDNGKVSLQPGWQSRDLTSPLAPIVVNGLVFAVSSGEYRPPASAARTTLDAAQRAQRSTPAVLYVLDGATGKTLWTSGTKITSFARAGLAASAGQVYLVTYDNHLYAFGIPIEH